MQSSFELVWEKQRASSLPRRARQLRASDRSMSSVSLRKTGRRLLGSSVICLVFFFPPFFVPNLHSLHQIVQIHHRLFSSNRSTLPTTFKSLSVSRSLRRLPGTSDSLGHSCPQPNTRLTFRRFACCFRAQCWLLLCSAPFPHHSVCLLYGNFSDLTFSPEHFGGRLDFLLLRDQE